MTERCSRHMPSGQAATAPERLRRLAREVERLGTSGRLDPEQIVVAKLSIARDMRRLVGELEAWR